MTMYSVIYETYEGQLYVSESFYSKAHAVIHLEYSREKYPSLKHRLVEIDPPKTTLGIDEMLDIAEKVQSICAVRPKACAKPLFRKTYE